MHADLLLKNLDAAHDFIAYTLVHEADHCSHKAWYAIVTLCVRQHGSAVYVGMAVVVCML